MTSSLLIAVCGTLLLAAPLGAQGTTLITVGPSGVADAHSDAAGVSDEGRFVLFESSASDLVAGDTNGAFDVFVRDRQLKLTELLSVPAWGGMSAGRSTAEDITPDGRFALFVSTEAFVTADDNGKCDVFLLDVLTGQTSVLSVPPSGSLAGLAHSDRALISADGSSVALHSDAPLVAADANNKTGRVRARQPGGRRR